MIGSRRVYSHENKENSYADIIDRIEQNFLGALLCDSYHRKEIMTILSGSDFLHADNRIIYNIMEDIVSNGNVLDTLTISEIIKNSQLLPHPAAESYVFNLAYLVPDDFSRNILSYAHILHCYGSIREWEGKR